MKIKSKKIFTAILTRIAQDGWTALAFERGAKTAGATPAEARKLFPDGIAAVVAAFHDFIDEAMQAKIAAKRNFPAMRVRDKITFAVRARLEAIEEQREVMRRLLVWSMMPYNIRTSTQALWQAADKIWLAAGDASTDYNYYTKRVLLCAVMKATLAFWLNDKSQGRSESWEFLDRRIEEVMKVGKGIGVAKTVGLSDILSFVRSRFAA